MWENESIDSMVDLFADAESGIDVGYSDEEMDFIEEVVMTPYWNGDINNGIDW